MMSTQKNSEKSKLVIAGFGAGVITSAALYIGYRLWSSSYNQTYKRISKLEYASNEQINKMLHCCATITEMESFGYLSTINSSDNNKEYPCCRMVECRWKPPITMPFINIGSNKSSRKYRQIAKNNNICLTFGDINGAGYVSLYGQLIEIKDAEKTKSMFPSVWRLFLSGPDDPRFVMFTLYIEKIEFVSHRFNLDSTRKDWKPFILNRVENTLFSDKAEWEIDE